MAALTTEQFADEWSQLVRRFSSEVVGQVSHLAVRYSHRLATAFYEHMLETPGARVFLNHEDVQSRLHASLQRWIIRIFAVSSGSDYSERVAHQVMVGDVHARIDVPVHLVLRGARLLKVRFVTLLRTDSEFEAILFEDAVRFISEVVDLAMEIMSHSYTRSNERNARAEEAYRLFSVAQNIGSERERQRAGLLDWENQLMFDHVAGGTGGQLPRITTSEFGLWFRHKGAHAFQGAPETGQILSSLDSIDRELLPELDVHQLNREQQIACLRRVRDQVRTIAYHLDHLFELNSELEAGRDVLTRLLNRKYLGAVLSRQIDYCRHHDTNFALLVIDVDRFKAINDNHGHDSGDLVLQQLAVTLNNSIRSGDYLFRLGGEEFLAVLVDIDRESALYAAEKVRRRVADEPIQLSRGLLLDISISIGVALYDGHPDYQHVLQRADEALYEAKSQGRNRTVMAE